jgi:hypothetical protein
MRAEFWWRMWRFSTRVIIFDFWEDLNVWVTDEFIQIIFECLECILLCITNRYGKSLKVKRLKISIWNYKNKLHNVDSFQKALWNFLVVTEIAVRAGACKFRAVGLSNTLQSGHQDLFNRISRVWRFGAQRIDSDCIVPYLTLAKSTRLPILLCKFSI